MTLASLGADAGYPNLNVASVPENVRQGGSKAMQAYAEGLSFEGVLVNELSQQMSKTMFGGEGLDGSSDSDSDDGSSASDGSSSSGGLLSSASAYSSLIPQTLTSSIMDSGGLGMAEQFAQEIDPSLTSSATAGAASSSATSSSSIADPATSDSTGSQTVQSAGTGGGELSE
jgi:Rod binding domain-containing protein